MSDVMGDIERFEWSDLAVSMHAVQSLSAKRILLDYLRLRYEAEVRDLHRQLEGAVEERNRYWQALVDIAGHENWEPRTMGDIAREALDHAETSS